MHNNDIHSITYLLSFASSSLVEQVWISQHVRVGTSKIQHSCPQQLWLFALWLNDKLTKQHNNDDINTHMHTSHTLTHTHTHLHIQTHTHTRTHLHTHMHTHTCTHTHAHTHMHTHTYTLYIPLDHGKMVRQCRYL